MSIFFQIVLGAPALGVSMWGLGWRLGLKESPAAAIMGAWTLILSVCAAVWFASFPAIYGAPVIVVLLALGLATAVAKLPRRQLALGAMGGALIGVLFAAPFALVPRLMAYAHWGTDQWGYTGVSKWLVLHSVKELPVFDLKPGLAWVWTVLVVQDRPLLYELQAIVSAGFGLEPSVAYYVLPAALQASLFLAVFASGVLREIGGTSARLAVALGVAVQPTIWLHFQHQFLGGTIAALLLLLLVAALLEQHGARRRDANVFATGVLLAGLVGAIYTVNVSYAALALVGLLWLPAAFRPAREQLGTFSWRAMWRPAVLLALAAACAIGTRFATREPALAVSGDGSGGHTLAQIGAVFGETEITPWYQRAGGAGALGISPADYAPDNTAIGIVCAVVALILGGVLSWRWWRRGDGFGPAAIFGAVLVVIAIAVPPRGDNVLLSRCLPVFAPLWLLTLCVVGAVEASRPLRWLAIGLACLPLVRAAPGMARMLTKPVNAIADGQWSALPDGDSWSCGAYAYFYQDTRDIDWSKAPQAFHEMTHFLPAAMRPDPTRKK